MIIPRMKFEGADSAKQMNRVFAENLQDLINKVDEGEGEYESGFLHTSTIKHDGTCYYDDVWSRDGGRGLIELARFGFEKQALMISEYFLRNMNHDDHWGRTVQTKDRKMYEVDGNVMVLLGIFRTWLVNGKNNEMGREFLNRTMPVFKWMERLMNECPYGDLLPCESELSGNPNTPYQVYGIYPNYGVVVVLSAYMHIACRCGCMKENEYLKQIKARLAYSLTNRLVAGERGSLTPKGCWVNGLDGRDGRPYEFSEWDGTSWPVYHWTRQLPFIFDSDFYSLSLEKSEFYQIHKDSYKYIHHHMCQGEYFRKYGFVSNSGWTGMGGRHDDTMCGYGQGFMTQASLMVDDINTYTKLVEGITRLAYDGDIVSPMTYDMNPWIMHECFNYENYEKGFDHTFGVMAEGRVGIINNPGDEGNLVQEAEIIKTMAIVAGIENSYDGKLRIMPRIPWTWDEIQVKDFPVVDENGHKGRIDFRLEHERWLRKSSFTVSSTIPLDNVDIRVGPFPSNMRISENESMEIERCGNGSWVWVRGLKGKKIEYEIKLNG